MTTRTRVLQHDSRSASAERRPFPGRRWLAVALAFPLAGYLGWTIGGPVDAVAAAAIGGAITGAGLGATQWWAAKNTIRDPLQWIVLSAAGYGGGLAAAAPIVGYETDIAALAVMGLVSGALLGTAQGVALARQGQARLAAAWALAMPILFALGWCASTALGVGVEDQFTVFGAAGAIVFTMLSGLVLARFEAGASSPGASSAS